MQEYEAAYGTCEVHTEYFTCLACRAEVKHNLKNISLHLQNSHQMNPTQYEDQFGRLPDSIVEDWDNGSPAESAQGNGAINNGSLIESEQSFETPSSQQISPVQQNSNKIIDGFNGFSPSEVAKPGLVINTIYHPFLDYFFATNGYLRIKRSNGDSVKGGLIMP